ncbi:MAG: class I SAM-dependent rRNA methyltransferase [Spirochaetes bacterium]|nr:class I SAM-dependent rRNA methyltransferase [Spirochaetota bacterium]
MDIPLTILSAFEKRGSLHDSADTDCYRLFNLAGDGMPGLSIDRYGEYLLVQYFNQEVGGNTGAIIASVERAAARLPFGIRGIVCKDRIKTRDREDIASRRHSMIAAGEAPPEGYRVRQCGVTVAVDLMRGQSTGLFLDMREVRQALAPLYPSGGSLLNLFCYTALFSVHALLRGMRWALNVDLSRQVLRRAMHNYTLNGLGVDHRDFLEGDALQWIRRLARQGRRFDLGVIDPPTFSRNRKRSFSVKRHMPLLLRQAGGLCAGGFLLTSVNSHSMDFREYRSLHPAEWILEAYFNESWDFVRSGEPYLKAGLWRVR